MRFLSLCQVRERVPLSKTQIYRLMKSGEFPRAVPLGSSRVAWVEDEIVQWMEKRLDRRRPD